MNNFDDLQITQIPCQALHIGWSKLQEIANVLFSRLLNRDIQLDVNQWDYYDWGIKLTNTKLTIEELEKLFVAVDADDWDRKRNDFDGIPIQSLNQSLSRKLISLLLPFHVDSSLADDEGVWFMGEHIIPQAGIKPILPDEMPEDETLFDLICDSVDHERKVYDDEMHRQGAAEILSNTYNTSILHEVAGMCTDDLGNYFSLEDDLAKLKVIYDLTHKGIFLETIVEWSLELDSVDVSNYGATELLIRDFCEDYPKFVDINEDYRYEICGKAGEIIETDYVCLDTAIEYALENDGYTINQLWYPVDEDGGIDYGAEITAANVVWERSVIQQCEDDCCKED